MNTSTLELRGLRVATKSRTLVAGVDLFVRPGETVGIVGESGSGKSLTARSIVGLLPPGIAADGSIMFGERDVLHMRDKELRRLRGREIALVLQDPFTMLNPLQRCGKHIEEGLERGGRDEVLRRLAEVGIHDPRVADRYPFELSGGMRQRVGIAAALARDPALLIADEPTTALDASTQRGILTLLKSLQEARGMGLVLVTHDLRVAFSVCDRVYVLYAGSILETAPAGDLEQDPLHPYTLGLLRSEPSLDRRGTTLHAIEGNVPSPDDVKGICPFAPRCECMTEACLAPVRLRPVGELRSSACTRIDEIAPELRRSTVPDVEVAAPSRTGSPLLRVSDLTKVFTTRGRRGHDVVALDGVSLTVGEGESVGLVGESGSGKTTLARLLVGLEQPTSGSIEVGGRIQIVFQDPYSSLNPARTIGAALQQALRAGGERGDVGELLERVGLPAGYAARKPVALSGGERQRVAIARALAVRPKILVCDEPVSALDVSVQAQILNLLQELRRDLGLAYLFITHDLAVVRQCVDHVYVLHQGKVVEEDTVDAVLDAPQHAYTRTLLDAALRSAVLAADSCGA